MSELGTDFDNAEVRMRLAEPKDIKFIVNMWISSYRNGQIARDFRTKPYYETWRKIIYRLLAQSTVLVLCDRMDPDNLIGFVCYQTFSEQENGAQKIFCLHYIAIRYGFQGKGLARGAIKYALEMEDNPEYLICSHQNLEPMKELGRKAKQWMKKGKDEFAQNNIEKSKRYYSKYGTDGFMYTPLILFTLPIHINELKFADIITSHKAEEKNEDS